MEEEQGKKKAADNECVSVVVRCRPMNRKENDEKRGSIIDIDVAARQVLRFLSLAFLLVTSLFIQLSITLWMILLSHF